MTRTWGAKSKSEDRRKSCTASNLPTGLISEDGCEFLRIQQRFVGRDQDVVFGSRLTRSFYVMMQLKLLDYFSSLGFAIEGHHP